MFCSECGTKNDDYAKICSVCNKELTILAAAQQNIGDINRRNKRDRKSLIKLGAKLGIMFGVVLTFMAWIISLISPYSSIGANCGAMIARMYYFGSYGALIVLSHLTGGPVEPTLISKTLTIIVVFLSCVSPGIVLGLIFGTSIAYAVDLILVEVSKQRKK